MTTRQKQMKALIRRTAQHKKPSIEHKVQNTATGPAHCFNAMHERCYRNVGSRVLVAQNSGDVATADVCVSSALAVVGDACIDGGMAARHRSRSKRQHH